MDISVLPYLILLLFWIGVITLVIIIVIKIQITQYFLQPPRKRIRNGIAIINLVGSLPIAFAMLIILRPVMVDIAVNLWYSFEYYGTQEFYSTQEMAFLFLRYGGISGLILVFIEVLFLQSVAMDRSHRPIWMAAVVGNLLSYLVVSTVSILTYHYLIYHYLNWL